MKEVVRSALIVSATALLAGCGSGDEKRSAEAEPSSEVAAPESMAAAPDRSRKVCELKITSPIARQWTTYWDNERVQYNGNNDSFASSIHWADAEAEKALASHPNALSFTCKSDESPEIMVTMQAIGSTKVDIPLGAGTYPIVPRATDGAVKPGTFLAVMHLDGALFEASGGTLKVERLDMNGVAGSFVVDGAENPVVGTRTMHLEGTIDIPCVGDQLERLCTAPERRRQ